MECPVGFENQKYWNYDRVLLLVVRWIMTAVFLTVFLTFFPSCFPSCFTIHDNKILPKVRVFFLLLSSSSTSKLRSVKCLVLIVNELKSLVKLLGEGQPKTRSVLVVQFPQKLTPPFCTTATWVTQNCGPPGVGGWTQLDGHKLRGVELCNHGSQNIRSPG